VFKLDLKLLAETWKMLSIISDEVASHLREVQTLHSTPTATGRDLTSNTPTYRKCCYCYANYQKQPEKSALYAFLHVLQIAWRCPVRGLLHCRSCLLKLLLFSGLYIRELQVSGFLILDSRILKLKTFEFQNMQV